MSELTMLQIGEHSLAEKYSIPDDIEWIVFTPERFNHDLKALKEKYKKEKKRLNFNMVIVTDLDENVDLMLMDSLIPSYTFFYTENVEALTDEQRFFFKKKMSKQVAKDKLDNFMIDLGVKFFSGQYGDSVAAIPINYQVNPMYQNGFEYEGRMYIVLDDDFGEEYYPIISAIYNIFTPEKKKMETWLEYVKDEGVDIKIEISEASEALSGTKTDKWSIEAGNLHRPAIINSSTDKRHYYGINIFVKGKGKVKIGKLHQRWTRIDQGFFINGGSRIVDQNQEEFFYYFDPGDMKPPLNVYFSGFKSAEGFEGYFMMKGMGAPFLLITDTRLEGGGFYLGSEELENGLVKVIQDKLKWLGFTNQDLILSGLSMGTFGAMYYGLSLNPYAILLGKPLLDVGNIPVKSRLHGPGFNSTVDILLSKYKANDEEAARKLDDAFWEKFAKADLTETTIYATYMKQDDLDDKAFYHMTRKADEIKKVAGRGYTGRHNDDTPAIVRWFIAAYNHVLYEFGRGESHGL